MVEERNKLFIPEAASSRRVGCPRCQHPDFEGRRKNGVPTFTCKQCKNEWQGGLPQEVKNPDAPNPPEKYIPPVRLERSIRGDDNVEVRRRVDPTQDFRKGALIPDEGEE